MDMVDVLAVMDLAQGTLRLAARGGDFSLAGNQTMAHQDSIGMAEARAAVAELIEAAEQMAEATGGDRCRCRANLRAALARVQGGAA